MDRLFIDAPIVPARPIRIYIGSGILSMTMGLVLILGSENRISSEAYRVIQQTGGGATWGWFYLLLGIVFFIIRQRPKPLRWTLLAAAFGYGAFAISFGIAAYRFGNANLTAPVVYLWVCFLHIIASERTRRGAWWTLPRGVR